MNLVFEILQYCTENHYKKVQEEIYISSSIVGLEMRY